MDSVYKKIDKVRKPRVHISYELENGGQTEKKELPFVVGVMGDYSGHSDQAKVSFKERKFINIDGDNFNQVMQKMSPELRIKVANQLVEEADQELAVELKFNSMDDFEPDRIAEQVPALKKLLDIRSQLRDLVSKADRSDELEGLLEQVLQDNEQIKALAGELGSEEAEAENKEKTDE
mgnify:CR=1 FL=1